MCIYKIATQGFIFKCATQVLSTNVQNKGLSTNVDHKCYLGVCNTNVYLRVCNTIVICDYATQVFIYECATHMICTSVEHMYLPTSVQHKGLSTNLECKCLFLINVWWNGQTWQAETIMSYSAINSTEKRVRKSKSTWSEYSAREPVSVSRLPTFDQSVSQEWFRVLVFRLSISCIPAFSNTQNRSINRIVTRYNLLGSTPERRWQT